MPKHQEVYGSIAKMIQMIINSTGPGTFTKKVTKLCIPVVTLPTKDDTKVLQQLNSGLQRTVNLNI